MALEKTTTLSGDPAQNENKFRELLEKDSVLFVVQGTGPKSDNLATIADLKAGMPDDPREVVWAKNPDDIANVVSGLSSSVSPPPSTSDLGFTVSLTNWIRDVIRADETTLDNTRVIGAYTKADLDE